MRLILTLLLALFAVPAAAQPGNMPAEVPADAVLAGRFVQERRLSGFEAPLVSEGTFVLAPGHGIIWRTVAPFESATVLGPKALLQISSDGEVSRLPASRVPLLGQILAMMEGTLSGRWEALESQFAVERRQTPSGWHVRLTPHGGQGVLASQIEAIEGDGGRFLERLVIHRSGGDVDIISFPDATISRTPLSPEQSNLFAQAS